MTDYPLMLVTWLDHTGSADWKHKTEYSKAEISTVDTIGWLVHKDVQKYVIHSSIIRHDDVSGGETVILRRNITEEYVLDMTH